MLKKSAKKAAKKAKKNKTKVDRLEAKLILSARGSLVLAPAFPRPFSALFARLNQPGGNDGENLKLTIGQQ